MGLGVADQNVNSVWGDELWSDKLPCGAVMTRAALLKPLWPAEMQCETEPISGSNHHAVFLEFGLMRPYELVQWAHTSSDLMRAWGSIQTVACAPFCLQSFWNKKKEVGLLVEFSVTLPNWESVKELQPWREKREFLLLSLSFLLPLQFS